MSGLHEITGDHVGRFAGLAAPDEGVTSRLPSGAASVLTVSLSDHVAALMALVAAHDRVSVEQLARIALTDFAVSRAEAIGLPALLDAGEGTGPP